MPECGHVHQDNKNPKRENEMIHITADDMVNALEAVVDEKGADYQYPSDLYDAKGGVCMYQVDGAPACIAGAALHRLGVSGDELRLAEEMPADSAMQILKDHGLITFDYEAGQIVAAAQQVQDVDARPGRYHAGADNTWGAALEAARKVYAERS
jgi:hypothetical protein